MRSKMKKKGRRRFDFQLLKESIQGSEFNLISASSQYTFIISNVIYLSIDLIFIVFVIVFHISLTDIWIRVILIVYNEINVTVFYP